jgi:sugar lactone lactonase YvrE
LFVAGGPTGQGRVIDARTGAVLATYQFTTGDTETFVNDVVVTKDSAWFTDSVNPVLYRVPLDLGPAETLPLTGDLVYEEGFNVNGIEATANGRTLVLVQTNTGELFTADPKTGATHEIALSEPVPFGDGILLHGRTLYVVQNQLNQIAVARLSFDLSRGVITRLLTHDSLDIPTTIDRLGRTLYVVNARFTTPPEPTTDYSITAIRRR